ncbi:MAG: lipopolysaccharide biosynthesis protein [Gammaproteobacteria bacterium]|nr:lipopolysaccharide biosynthesis protein [Gammaproteobacteria bacterium]
MDETSSFNLNVTEVLKRRLPIASVVLATLLFLTIAAALGLPSVYTSRAVILIEQQEIPQDLVRSMVTSFADQRIQVISQRVLTNSNLSSIIEKYDLYTNDRGSKPLETVIETMREDIAVTPISADVVDPKQGRAVQATIAFDLSYQSERAETAQRVANELVSLFLNENLRQRQETSTQTVNFLAEESEKLGRQVSEVEQKLATFKERNYDQLPEMQSINIEMRNRMEADVRQLDTQISSLEQQRVYLESELAQQQPNSLLYSASGERVLSAADRLKVAESDFAQLSARYGPNHPDVVARRKEIEALRSEVAGSGDGSELAIRLKDARASLAAAREKYSADHPDIKRIAREISNLEEQLARANTAAPAPVLNVLPDNPAYIQLKARLEATDSDIRSWRAQRADLRARISGLEAGQSRAPEVEREYRKLMRDYEVAQSKYQEVLAKRQEAELSSNLESEKQGERFTLIEPPVVPQKPSKPNRVAIGALGSVLAFVGGIGSGALVEMLDHRIYGRAAIQRLLGVPPLAVVPNIKSDASLRKRRLNWMLAIAGAILLLAVAAICVHLFFTPLDVLFFVLTRKLGF